MKAVMLYGNDSPHPAHKTWGDAIDCTYRHFETNQPPGNSSDSGSLLSRFQTGIRHRDADLIIAEGSAPLQTGLVAKAFGANKLVYICADQTFMTLENRNTEPFWNYIPDLIDGVIAVSYLAWSWAAPYIDAPVEIIRPPISDEKYRALKKVTPQSGDGPIVSIGKARPTKQFNLLPQIAERTGKEVLVVGPGHENMPYVDHNLVSTPTWLEVEDFATVLEQAALYVQPSSGDACPVATMEAMLSGTPTIVSIHTGTRELGARPFPVDFLPIAAESYIEESPSKSICRGMRKNVIEYTEKNQTHRFKRVINSWT